MISTTSRKGLKTPHALRKGREKMIAVLEIIRCAAAVALLVVLAMYVAYRWYVSVKENAYEEAEESIKRAVREAGRPIVKIEIQTKGKW